MSEQRHLTFLFSLGQHVHYDGVRYRVISQRWTQGTFSACTEYLLAHVDCAGGLFWAYEPDLLPVEDAP